MPFQPAQKQREQRDISLRIAGKSPWLRNESATALAEDLAARPPLHTDARPGAGVHALQIGADREGNRDYTRKGLPDSPRILDTSASPPDSSPQSPHLVVDSEIRTKS